jgi:hypothetical protein
VQEDVRHTRIVRQTAGVPSDPAHITSSKLFFSFAHVRTREPSAYGGFVEVEKQALAEKLGRRQPIRVLRDWSATDSRSNVFDVAVGRRRRCFETSEAVKAGDFAQSMDRRGV